MTDSIEIIQPDDWHLHLRDGDVLPVTVAASAKLFKKAIVMPNLTPPVTNTRLALEYQQRILATVPAGRAFEPLMTLYLTDHTRADDISEAKASGIIAGCKLYPAGATTNSAAGVTNIDKLNPALEAMQEQGLPLLIHGEVVTEQVDIFDREKVFIDSQLAPLVDRFPDLPVVLEHITTEDAVRFIQQAPDHIAATVTAHHLLLNRNDMLVGGIRPHYFCLPILKRARHQQALREIVVSGSPKFFLGTDSAPHTRESKESACGCAGCYTAPIALALYAEVFDEMDALDKLEGFSSLYGAQFYGRSVNTRKVRLTRTPNTIPHQLPFANSSIIPFRAGEPLQWQAQLI